MKGLKNKISRYSFTETRNHIMTHPVGCFKG
jgi:hypothetical protein